MEIFWQPGLTLEHVEKQVILKALRFFNGNKPKTANSLDIALRTLDNKLLKYQKDSESEEIKREQATR